VHVATIAVKIFKLSSHFLVGQHPERDRDRVKINALIRGQLAVDIRRTRCCCRILALNSDSRWLRGATISHERGSDEWYPSQNNQK
jgi:hypothetical protein